MVNSFMHQSAKAAEEHAKMHQRLMDAGARWDGMDGYDMTNVHAKRRENDEWFCRRCGKRWGTEEEEPSCE